MTRRRAHPVTATVFLMPAVCYAASCALGVSAALRPIRTGGSRRLHHTLYVATVTLTAVALGSALWGPPRSRRAALALLPAVVPLAAIPSAGTGTRRHPVLALTAAPFFIAGVVRST